MNIPGTQSLKLLRWAMLALGLSLIAFNVWRASVLDFTHDESISYQYLGQRYMEIISYNAKPQLPNNHILNTVGMKIAYDLGCEAPWAMRIPILLSFGLYLWHVGRFMERMRNRWLGLLGFTLLGTLPYLLDFFCLARGYAMGCAFMLASMQCYLRWMETGDRRGLNWAFGYAGLSIFANLTFVNYLLVFLGIHLLHGLVFGRFGKMREFLRLHAVPVVILGLTVAFAFEPVRKLTSFGMAYGGEEGFWRDTVGTMLQDLWYGIHMSDGLAQGNMLLVQATVVGLCIWTVVLALRKALERSGYFLAFGVLLGLGISCVLQFQLIHTPFLFHRTALIFMPLYPLALLFCLDSVPLRLPPWAQAATALPLAAALILFLCTHLRTDRVLEWPLDSHTEEVLARMDSLRPHDPHVTVRISCWWYFEPGLNYYRISRNLDWLEPVTRDGVGIPGQFYFLGPEDYAAVPPATQEVLLDDPELRIMLTRPRSAAE